MFTSNKLINELREIVSDQRLILQEVHVITKQQAELLKKHDSTLDTLVSQGAVNSTSLEHHIKRTDILQSRQYKIIMLCSIGLGAALVTWGPEAMRFLGFLL
jgi:hypothetical protein